MVSLTKMPIKVNEKSTRNPMIPNIDIRVKSIGQNRAMNVSTTMTPDVTPMASAIRRVLK